MDCPGAYVKYAFQKEGHENVSLKAEGMGTDLVGEALSFQLLFFESLLQSENLSLVFLYGQLYHLAGLGDPLVGSCPDREETEAHFQKAHHHSLQS